MHAVPLKETCISIKKVVAIVIVVLTKIKLCISLRFHTGKIISEWIVITKATRRTSYLEEFREINMIVFPSFSLQACTYMICLVFCFSDKHVHVMLLTIYSPVPKSLHRTDNAQHLPGVRFGVLTMTAKNLTIPMNIRKINLCKINNVVVGLGLFFFLCFLFVTALT